MLLEKIFDFISFQSLSYRYKVKVKVKLLSRVQLFATPMDCSPPGSFIHGIFQARILKWVAISFFKGSSPPMDWTPASCIGRQILYH